MNRRGFFKSLAVATAAVPFLAFTHKPKPTNLDKVSVRRLCLEVKKMMSTIGRGYVFEPCDTRTELAYRQEIVNYMNELVQRKAIRRWDSISTEHSNYSISADVVFVPINIDHTVYIESVIG